MKSSDAREPIAQRMCGKFTYANVTSSLAVMLAFHNSFLKTMNIRTIEIRPEKPTGKEIRIPIPACRQEICRLQRGALAAGYPTPVGEQTGPR
jgi:hypothetical protein